MTIKTWTLSAEGIKYKPIQLYFQDNVLYWSRGYYFVDGDGEPISTVVDGEVILDIGENISGQMPWDDIPQGIKDV